MYFFSNLDLYLLFPVQTMWVFIQRYSEWKPLQFLAFIFFYRIFEKLKAFEPAISTTLTVGETCSNTCYFFQTRMNPSCIGTMGATRVEPVQSEPRTSLTHQFSYLLDHNMIQTQRTRSRPDLKNSGWVRVRGSREVYIRKNLFVFLLKINKENIRFCFIKFFF